MLYIIFMERKNNNVSVPGKVLRIFLIVILLPFLLCYVCIRKIKKRKIDKNNSEKVQIFDVLQLNSLSGTEFEDVICQLFNGLGFKAKLTKASGDFGADILAERDHELSVIQTKCYSGVVGSHAVQEVLGAREHYGTARAFVVTNSYFSKEAQTIALENDIILIDKTTLAELTRKVRVFVQRKNINLVALTGAARAEIEARYNFWI